MSLAFAAQHLCQSHPLFTPPWTESRTQPCSTRRDFSHCYLEPNSKFQAARLIDRLRGCLCCLLLTYKLRKLCSAGSAHGRQPMMHRDFLACEHFRCLTSTNQAKETLQPPSSLQCPLTFLPPQGPQGQTGSPGGVGPKGRRVSGAVGGT